MVSEYNAGTDRRGRSREKLATLVRTRTETLSLYTELANQRPFEADEVTSEALQEFCQALIDYAASAHFQLYRFISDKLERRGSHPVVYSSVGSHASSGSRAVSMSVGSSSGRAARGSRARRSASRAPGSRTKGYLVQLSIA